MTKMRKKLPSSGMRHHKPHHLLRLLLLAGLIFSGCTATNGNETVDAAGGSMGADLRMGDNASAKSDLNVERPDGPGVVPVDTRPRDAASGVDAGSPPAASCSVTRAGGAGNDPGGLIPVCCSASAPDKMLVDQVFNLLNAHRLANGRPALIYDLHLEAAVQAHCQHMAEHPFFDHAAPETTVGNFQNRATACGTTAWGENIAYNQRTPEQVMNTWKNSAPHNENMLGNYTRVGIGLHQWRWGQLFGR
jgi:uncharacterized protein YkwD